MRKFNDIEYKRPDFKQLKKRLRAITKAVQNAPDVQVLSELLLQSTQVLNTAETSYSLAYIRNTMDTTNPFYSAEIQFYNKALPTLQPYQKKLCEAVLASRHVEGLKKKYGVQLLNLYRANAATSSTKLVPLVAKHSKLGTQYSKTVAGCTTEFRGEQLNLYGLLRHMQAPSRTQRKAAYLKWAKLYEGVSVKLDKQYDKLVSLRRKMGQRMDTDYIHLAYTQQNKFDYTPQDVAAFREQVLTVVTPLVAQMRLLQARRIGVDSIKYYDEDFLFKQGNPIPKGNQQQLLDFAAKMYHELSPETGEFFDFMTTHQLFDLPTRPGKHLGGYCTYLNHYKAPFIFSNFNGTSADVDVLTHEAGHAFELYTASRTQPIKDYYSATSEINEIHSMAMEFFAYPWMESFFGEQADSYRFAHLCDCIMTLPYLVCVDEFEHEVHSRPMPAQDRKVLWRSLEKKYMPWRDYDGVAFLAEGGFWMQKQHVFIYPLYYINYALAQFGALELYSRCITDHRYKTQPQCTTEAENQCKSGKQAWSDYLALCRAGGSKPYMELLKMANLSNPFAPGTVEQIIAPLRELLLTEPECMPLR